MKRALVAVALLASTGCAKKASPTASPAAADAAVAEDDYAAPEAEPTRGLEYDGLASFDALQARLDQLDADLSAEGIPSDEGERVGLTRPDAAPTAKATEDGDRCERICDLKDAICDVADRICGLADEHQDEAKYANACGRATQRCEQATTACERCEE